jgi:pimeloyl-ACP methyl ester carboxylesterase
VERSAVRVPEPGTVPLLTATAPMKGVRTENEQTTGRTSMPNLDVDGVNLYYEDLGEGDPLLLIHGAAASGRWFGTLPDRLARENRVIVPDLRGLGRSQRVEPLTRPQVWVEDMCRVLDAAGVEQADVVGVSLGSRIAGRFALEHPSRVRALVVDAPIVGLSSSGHSALSGVFSVVDPESEQGREWHSLHGDDWQDVVAFYSATRSGEGFQNYYTLRDRLHEIQAPTLICRGDFDDSIHPVDDAFVWHKNTRRSELLIAPGLSQSSVMLERPDDFVRALTEFQQRLSPTALAAS